MIARIGLGAAVLAAAGAVLYYGARYVFEALLGVVVAAVVISVCWGIGNVILGEKRP